MSYNSSETEILRHTRKKDGSMCTKVGKLTGMEWKRVTVSVAIRDEYLIMATECGTINLLKKYQTNVIY